MCSSRLCKSRQARLWRTWSLRARLLAGQIVLLTVACLGIGAVTELALYQYLVGQLDHQLSDASRRPGTGTTGRARGLARTSWTPPASRPAWSVP